MVQRQYFCARGPIQRFWKGSGAKWPPVWLTGASAAADSDPRTNYVEVARKRAQILAISPAASARSPLCDVRPA